MSINKVTVINIHRGKTHYHHYCGRGSPVGNPYVMRDYSDEERDRVIDAYKNWFMIKVQHSTISDFNVYLKSLVEAAKKGPINLGCYCAPKRCHCDIIKLYINNQLRIK